MILQPHKIHRDRIFLPTQMATSQSHPVTGWTNHFTVSLSHRMGQPLYSLTQSQDGPTTLQSHPVTGWANHITVSLSHSMGQPLYSLTQSQHTSTGPTSSGQDFPMPGACLKQVNLEVIDKHGWIANPLAPALQVNVFTSGDGPHDITFFTSWHISY